MLLQSTYQQQRPWQAALHAVVLPRKCCTQIKARMHAGDATIAEVLDLIAWQTPLTWHRGNACTEDVWPPVLQEQVGMLILASAQLEQV